MAAGSSQISYERKVILVFVELQGGIMEDLAMTKHINFIGLLALLVWCVLMIELYSVYKNFGKGLKERG